MNKLQSKSKFITGISFPDFSAAQHYMSSTWGNKVSLPDHIKQYEKEVQNLCNNLGYKGIIHVTVDEKQLQAGQMQRKPHPHVDGRFMNARWGHGGGGWNHTCNEIPKRMSVAVASNVARCKVFVGEFIGEPSEQGCLKHISNQIGEGKIINENEWHLLSPDCVHESLPMETNCKRSFIRVAFEDDLQW